MIAVLLLAAEKKFWILDPLYTALGWLLATFYAIIPNYGVAIILLTVTVSVLRMPLVAKQVKSQQEMQRIQPELKRLQAKYKADPQKRNEEMMRLYKEHGVNPFAGCLPLLLQMPLFIVLYRVILKLNAQPEPKHIPKDSELFRSLVRAGGKMHSFGMDLAQRASTVHGLGKLWPYLVLIGGVLGTGFYQQRQMTARLPKDAANQQMMVMTRILPVFMAFVSWSIPAGVVLYFLVSNTWQIGQQAVLFRRRQAADEAAKATGKKGPLATPSGESGSGSSGGGVDLGKGKGGGRAGGTGAASGGGGRGGGGGTGGGGGGGTGGGGRERGGGAAGASDDAEPKGLFARLAKAMGTPDSPAKPGASGSSGSGGSAGGSQRGNAKSNGAGGGRGSGRGKAASGGSKGGSGSSGAGGGGGGGGGGGKGTAGRSGTNGRVTPRGGGGPQGRGGTKSRNTRRGK